MAILTLMPQIKMSAGEAPLGISSFVEALSICLTMALEQELRNCDCHSQNAINHASAPPLWCFMRCSKHPKQTIKQSKYQCCPCIDIIVVWQVSRILLQNIACKICKQSCWPQVLQWVWIGSMASLYVLHLVYVAHICPFFNHKKYGTSSLSFLDLIWGMQ